MSKAQLMSILIILVLVSLLALLAIRHSPTQDFPATTSVVIDNSVERYEVEGKTQAIRTQREEADEEYTDDVLNALDADQNQRDSTFYR